MAKLRLAGIANGIEEIKKTPIGGISFSFDASKTLERTICSCGFTSGEELYVCPNCNKPIVRCARTYSYDNTHLGTVSYAVKNGDIVEVFAMVIGLHVNSGMKEFDTKISVNKVFTSDFLTNNDWDSCTFGRYPFIDSEDAFKSKVGNVFKHVHELSDAYNALNLVYHFPNLKENTKHENFIASLVRGRGIPTSIKKCPDILKDAGYGWDETKEEFSIQEIAWMFQIPPIGTYDRYVEKNTRGIWRSWEELTEGQQRISLKTAKFYETSLGKWVISRFQRGEISAREIIDWESIPSYSWKTEDAESFSYLFERYVKDCANSSPSDIARNFEKEVTFLIENGYVPSYETIRTKFLGILHNSMRIGIGDTDKFIKNPMSSIIELGLQDR